MSTPMARPDPLPAADLWSRYRDNGPRHLMGLARHLQSRVMGRLQQSPSHPDLRLSFGPILSLVAGSGRPISVIARELVISKQSASQLATQVERAGYLERAANPIDGRSRMLVLTERGEALIGEAVGLIRSVESEYADQVGARRYRAFTNALADLHDGMRLPTLRADEIPVESPSGTAGLLPLIVERIQEELMRATIAKGHPGLKRSYGQILPLIGADGGRIHHIASVQQVSRQAISALARELEALGYLTRDADPDDGRGVVLRLTPRGETLIADSVDAVDAIEADHARILGAAAHETLGTVARELYRGLGLEEEDFGPARGGEASGSDEPAAGSAATAVDGGQEIEQLAESLRQRLGRGDAARLAALLDPKPRRMES